MSYFDDDEPPKRRDRPGPTGQQSGRPAQPRDRMELDAYTRTAVDGELGRLSSLSLPWREGDGWDHTVFEVACNLIELANSPWNGYTLDDAEFDLLKAAPEDHVWGVHENQAKWDSALKRVGDGDRPEPLGHDTDVTEVEWADVAPSGGDSGDPEATTGWLPEDLADLARDVANGTWQPPKPTLGTLPDLVGMFYPGCTHAIAGESGVGKSMLAAYQVAHVIRAGGRAVWIDYESTPGLLLHRLIHMCELTVDEVLGQLLYIRPKSRIDANGIEQIALHLRRQNADRGTPGTRDDGSGHVGSLVVVDSYGHALGFEGFDKRSMDEDQMIRKFMQRYPSAIAETTDAAVVLLDHTPKHANGRADHAIGSQRKRADLTGAHYGLEGKASSDEGATLQCSKDRNGGVPEATPLASWRIEPGGKLSLTTPIPGISRAEQKKDEDNGHLLEVIKRHPGEPVRGLRELTGWGGGRVAEALTRLENLGHIRFEEGLNRAKFVHPTAL